MMGATVSATHVSNSNNDGEPVWETDIGVPSTVVVNSNAAVHAVTMNGAMFPIDTAAVRTGVTNQRSARIDPRLVPHAFSQQIPVSTNRVLFAGPPPTSHVTVANLISGQLERIPLRIDTDRATTELVNFNGSLLAACDTGPIYLLDAATGARRIGPFMPRIEPGTRFDWLPPAPIGSNQFVAAEKSGHLYRVAVNDKQMTLANENTIAGELIGGLALVGTTAYAAVQSGGTDLIVSINANELTLRAQTPMANGLAWGPKRVGSLVIAADGNHTVYAFDALGKLRWKTSQPIGPLAGDPLIRGERMLFTSTMGLISVVDQSGNVIASQQIGEPIGSGPVAFKGGLLVAGWDGTLYMTDVPQ
jgi:outer membrane protein assembly factor BamB